MLLFELAQPHCCQDWPLAIGGLTRLEELTGALSAGYGTDKSSSDGDSYRKMPPLKELQSANGSAYAGSDSTPRRSVPPDKAEAAAACRSAQQGQAAV